MLAVGAAQLRGVAVGSVCTVYGVVLPDSSGGAHAGHTHPYAEHAGHDGQTPGSDEAHAGGPLRPDSAGPSSRRPTRR